MPAESRREILEVMIRLVGVKGYADVTVADVIAAADSSETTFYSHFAGKHDCFLAAYATLMEQLLEGLFAGCDASSPWATRMRVGLETTLERFAADPELGRAAMVEAGAAGADALRLYFEAIGRLAEFVDAGREEDPGRALPDHIALMAIGGVAGLISDEIAAGRARQLPELLPALLFALLLPYVGAETATAEMQRASAGH